MKQLDVDVSSPANIIGPRPTFIHMTLTNVTFVLNEILSSSFGLVTDRCMQGQRENDAYEPIMQCAQVS